jgi:hypothetical protein
MRNYIIVLAIIILIVLWKKRAKATPKPNENSNTGTLTDSVLQKGSQGLDVRRLQMKLNEIISKAVNEEIPVSYSLDNEQWHLITQPLVVDGIFGRATEVMLHAITGESTIKVSEIDSLTLKP